MAPGGMSLDMRKEPTDRFRLEIRLDDGRLIEDAWSGFSQKGRRRHASIPKIVHAVAGSASPFPAVPPWLRYITSPEPLTLRDLSSR